MIRGFGIDLVDISRIRHAVQKPHFAERVFTETERSYANAKPRPEESYAGMFAAKEATLKAFGCGLGGADLLEIEVLHDAAGCPFLQLYGRAVRQLSQRGAARVHVSITHTDSLAMAQVILEDESGGIE